MKRNRKFETIAAQAGVGPAPSLVRLSVGIEDRRELQDDLSRALRKATGLTSG